MEVQVVKIARTASSQPPYLPTGGVKHNPASMLGMQREWALTTCQLHAGPTCAKPSEKRLLWIYIFFFIVGTRWPQANGQHLICPCPFRPPTQFVFREVNAAGRGRARHVSMHASCMQSRPAEPSRRVRQNWPVVTHCSYCLHVQRTGPGRVRHPVVKLHRPAMLCGWRCADVVGNWTAPASHKHGPKQRLSTQGACTACHLNGVMLN